MRRIGIFCHGAVLVCLCVSGCSKGAGTAQAAESKSTAVKVAPVKAEDLRRSVDVVGTLAAVDVVTLSSEVEGKVGRILADLGDRVGPNQILVELDQEKLQYKLDQQRAAYNRALSHYGAQSDTALPAVEATPDVQRAAAELAQAQQAYDRTAELTKRSILSKQQLEDADATLKTKKAGYDSAVQGARNSRADIDSEHANLQLAERQLRDATIRAPFDAYIQQRLISPGEFVKAQAPVMTLVKVDPLRLMAEIPERLAPWIKVGQQMTLSVDAFPDPLTGVIARISPAVNQETRAFALEGRVANPDGRLKPGTFARVHLMTERVDHITTVPATALQYRYGVNRVFLIEGGALVSKEVRIGDRLGDRVEVLSGVAAGDSVVVSDVERLADGQHVSVGGGH